MADILQTTTVSLSHGEICEAISDYVEKMKAGDMPSMDRSSIVLRIPGAGDFMLWGMNDTTLTITSEK